ncbi:MAG: hypothetical protein LC620_07460, partial [Halobacteriales archaeon]|nr:hypothetical protein [Halobacteriales archaeon]
ALLLDGAGGDEYLAGTNVTCTGGGCRAGWGGVNGGVFGGGEEGVGFLLDAGSERDVYQAGVGTTCGGSECSAGGTGTNGGSYGSVAALIDLGGSDLYEAGVDATHSCALTSAAITGYACTAGSRGVQGGAASGGVGLLLDTFGNDTYSAGTGSSVTCTGSVTSTALTGEFTVGSLGVNGGTFLGAGLLVDGTGVDAYAAGTGSTLSCPALSVLFSGSTVVGFPDGVGKYGVNGGSGNLLLATNLESDWWPGVGLLWDAGSFGDTYADNEGGTGTDKTVVPKGTLGAQLDCEGALPPSCL